MSIWDTLFRTVLAERNGRRVGQGVPAEPGKGNKVKLTKDDLNTLYSLKDKGDAAHAESAVKKLFELYRRVSPTRHLGLKYKCSSADLTMLPRAETPRDLVRGDRFCFWLARGLGTSLDSLFSLRLPKAVGGMRYHFGAGSFVDYIPLAGPMAQTVIISLLFATCIRRSGGPMWLYVADESQLLGLTVCATVPFVGPPLSNFFRPAFMFGRDIQLWIKLRSELFADEKIPGSSKWRSQALADFFGVDEVVYTDEIRKYIMGQAEQYKPTGSALSHFCGV